MVGKGNGVKDRDMAGPCVYLGLSYPGTAASFRIWSVVEDVLEEGYVGEKDDTFTSLRDVC